MGSRLSRGKLMLKLLENHNNRLSQPIQTRSTQNAEDGEMYDSDYSRDDSIADPNFAPEDIDLEEDSDLSEQDVIGNSNLFLINRKVDSESNNVNWRKVRRVRYTKEILKTIFYKNTLDHADSFKIIILERRGKANEKLQLQRAYHSQLHISVKKKEHIMDLLPFISESLTDFYRNLPTDAEIRDIHPQSDGEEEDED
ncbi:unnamed protein product [Callosobruchus maculatus]|uniref:Uncharacterized protein n=1 Tax=Callosobruchus maculatus TaxID=64391 RepID=A0A653BRC2_CALMS|nr:unnamed protein product [Callosobruchus maculatus]